MMALIIVMAVEYIKKTHIEVVVAGCDASRW
jgi:hypothetical protein